MKKLAIFLFLLCLFPFAGHAQISNPSIVVVASAPSGSCSANLPDQQVVGTGDLYSCQSGVWAEVGGGGGSFTCNATNNCASLNGANTFTANQTIQDAVPTISFSGGSGSGTVGMNSSGDGVQLTSNTSIQFFGFDYEGTNYEGVGATGMYGFFASSTPTSAVGPDTAFTRIGTDIVALGNDSSLADASGWLQLSAIGSGASENTDLRGHVTLSSGAGTYSFSKNYTEAPTCVATDTTATDAVKASTTTTTLTLAGTGTDVVAYVCAD